MNSIDIQNAVSRSLFRYCYRSAHKLPAEVQEHYIDVMRDVWIVNTNFILIFSK